MNFDLTLINGIALGVEYMPPLEEEDIPHSIIVDLFILRFLIQW